MFCRIQRCTNNIFTKLPINLLHSYLRKMASDTSAPLATVELELPQGRIRGAIRETIYGHTYYSFESIPYAQPPIGKLRFRAPQPLASWLTAGIIDGTKSPPKPLQKNMRTGQVEGSEDCLYLNVFTKDLNSSKRMPVMVWLYGGGFATGHAALGHHGPDYFMRENVVVVSMNYRLCSLGFLSLSDPTLDVPGNAGLKDQLLALKWIKKYIYYFNGNSNNITVFGESAGAACAHYLALSEQTRGLFQQAILMSGSALSYWANMRQKDMAYRLARHHGYEGENVDAAVLKYLENLDAAKLVDHSILNAEEKKSLIWLTFSPTIEPYIAEHCVVPTDPVNMLKTTWSNSIPMVLGGNSYEGLLMYQYFKSNPEFIDIAQKQPEFMLPMEVKELYNDKGKLGEMGKSLVALYFDNNNKKDEVVAQQLQSDAKYDLLHLCSHKMFWHSLHRTALARSKYATANTYLYRFAFDSPTFNHHRLRFCGDTCVKGAAHADDLSYLFYIRESTKLEEDTEEYKTIQRMIGMWTNFAKFGNPNCTELAPLVWQPIRCTSPDFGLNIAESLQVMEIPDAAKLKAWDALYDKRMLYGATATDVEDGVEEGGKEGAKAT